MEEKKCFKCGFPSENLRKKQEVYLCEICFRFSPDEKDNFKQYIEEKINGEILETFRKHSKKIGENQKKGMIKKASKGELMSRVPFGYRLENKKLIPATNYKEVEEIFEEFLEEGMNLTRLAKKHNLSVNGLKKILKNFTYIGKIKFNNQIFEGNHRPLISSTLFNHVQNKLERIRK